jgi:hypothetical protein
VGVFKPVFKPLFKPLDMSESDLRDGVCWEVGAGGAGAGGAGTGTSSEGS